MKIELLEFNYPDSEDAYRRVAITRFLDNPEAVARYYYKKNLLRVAIEHADKLPQILKALAEEYGTDAITKAWANIHWEQECNLAPEW